MPETTACKINSLDYVFPMEAITSSANARRPRATSFFVRDFDAFIDCPLKGFQHISIHQEVKDRPTPKNAYPNLSSNQNMNKPRVFTKWGLANENFKQRQIIQDALHRF